MEQKEAQKLVAAALKDPRAYGIESCIVCKSGDITNVGLFVPTNPTFASRIGQPKGKTRVVVYALCESCFDSPNRDAQVEAAMIKDGGFQ